MNGNTIKYHTCLGIQEIPFTRIISFRAAKGPKVIYEIGIGNESGLHLPLLTTAGDSVTYRGRTYTYGRDLGRLEMVLRNIQNMEALEDL